MTAKTLMIQGTSSSAGKSLLVTGFCHYFARRGLSVAPFKAQNMSNNAAVCKGGGEIGRAQAVQAKAAGLEPTVDMNPVLIKPEHDSRAQVILRGERWKSLDAKTYYPHKKTLWKVVTDSLDRLMDKYDLVIIEGAGSPVELNLKENDIVNMAVANYAKAPVFVVGDIDRGGIFAQLLGTHWLLDPGEQARVKGWIINKFRGDRSLFQGGIDILEDKGGVPVLGVLPYLPDLHIPEEDAVALEGLSPVPFDGRGGVDIAVIHLPRISNFDDFDPLEAEENVAVRYVSSPGQLGRPHAVILPGTKSTIRDLIWMEEKGLAERIRNYAAQGGHVVGICGGYQMLGEEVRDPRNVESDRSRVCALGLLPVKTTFRSEKDTYQVRGLVTTSAGWLGEVSGLPLEGYEIHMGSTRGDDGWLTITERNGERTQVPDGAISGDGRVWGSYLHGLFANRPLRRAWLKHLGWRETPRVSSGVDPFHHSLSSLTEEMEENLDMGIVERVIWES